MNVIDVQNRSNYTISRGLIRRAVREVLLGENISEIPTIVVVEDEEMINLHTQFSGLSDTTDVLAFADEDEEGYLGDVIVNAAQAEREAKSRGLSFENEFIRYAIHGTLHLCGYKDNNQTNQNQMRNLEDLYLKVANID